MSTPFPYEGPPALMAPVLGALARVVDPEVAMSIVDIGLVRGVTVGPGAAHVTMTMTSAACPVTDVIVDEVVHELGRVLPYGCAVGVQLCWEPPWTPESMSERARRFMAW